MKKLVMVLAITLALLALATCSLFKGAITIHNISSHTLIEVYITPTTDPYWGDDLLYGQILPASDQTFEDLKADTYDVMVVDTFAESATFWGVQVSAGQTTTITVTD